MLHAGFQGLSCMAVINTPSGGVSAEIDFPTNIGSWRRSRQPCTLWLTQP